MAWGSGGVGSVPFGSTVAPVAQPTTLGARVLHVLKISKVLQVLKISKVTHFTR